MRGCGTAVAAHPYNIAIDTRVQLAAAAVLLHEGVQGGE
jgi:hypothetical protein